MTVRTIDDIFRDFVTDGVPASGPFNPHKPDIRDTLKALLEGISTFPDNRVIRLNNANEGTANNIVVTASVAIPAAAYQVLYILNVTQENTGPVTVSGAINRDLVTNINQPVPAGYLTPGMALLCIDTGTELRLLSYGDAEAVQAAAEAAADRAEEAAAVAEAAAGGLLSNFSSRSEVEVTIIPTLVSFLRTAGYYAAGDGGGALYKHSASEPIHAGKVQSSDGAWWELSETRPNVLMFGADNSGTHDSTDAFSGAAEYVGELGHIEIIAGNYRLESAVEVNTHLWIFNGEVTFTGAGNLVGNWIKYRPFGLEVGRDLDWRVANNAGVGLVVGEWVAMNQDDPGELATLRLFPFSVKSPTQLAIEPYFGDYSAGDRPENTLNDKGNGEDLCSFGLGSAGIKGDNSEERLVIVNKFKTSGTLFRHYDISVIATYSGELHPLFVNMGSKSVVKFDTNGVVNFWNCNKFGNVSYGNTIVNVQNPPLTNGIRLVARQGGSTSLVRYDGATENIELRMDLNGVSIGSGGIGSATHRLEVVTGDTTQSPIALSTTNASYAGEVSRLTVSRPAATDFAFHTARANGDLKFVVLGDGNVKCDGAFTGGGADYAEYFEWLDENQDAEDRTGLSVVLEDGKIRQAVNGENPIGVVSATAIVVGDAEPMFWRGKYLRDDLGRLQLESYEVVSWEETVPPVIEVRQVERTQPSTGEDGKPTDLKWTEDEEVVKEAGKVISHSYPLDAVPSGIVVPANATVSVLTRPILNPQYDDTIVYEERASRKEWDTVGLMGKLRLFKGQPTNPNWIKLRDVSEFVEEWLVR